MYESYLSLGGVEIANVDRLVGYARSADCAVSWLKTEGCGTLNTAMGEAFPYTIENIDQAPWYDPSQADVSSRFYGIMVVEAKGLSDSSRQISLTEGILDGGTIGGRRRAAREARFRVLLVAEGKDALDYGISWLSSALDGDSCGQHGDVCGLVDLAFLVDCPPKVSEVYAGGTLIPDTPDNIIEDLSDQVTDLEPIVDYAPPIEGSGNWAQAYENLFTNSNLVGDGTWAEIFRNELTNPLISRGLGPWTMYASGDHVETPDGRKFTYPSGVDAHTSLLMNDHLFTALEGERWGSSVSVRAGETPVSLSLLVITRSTGKPSVSVRENIDLDPGESWTFSVLSDPVQADGSEVGLRLTSNNGLSLGASFEVLDGWTVFRDYRPTGPFSGNSPDFSVDSDMRTRWLGTENASESVMEGQNVRGVGANSTNLAIASTKYGKPAIRLIRQSTGNHASAKITIPTGDVRVQGTVVGTRHQDTVLSSPIISRAARVDWPMHNSAPPTNEPGSESFRIVFENLTSSYAVYLFHGGGLDSGDVWWTDIGIYAGNYPYDSFNGESDPADTGIEQPEDFRIRWTGQPDESTSVMEIEQVETYAGMNAVAGMSTWEGKPAIRIIPTGSSNSSSAYAFLPISAPSVTAIGTVALNEQLQGELSPYALVLEIGSVQDSAPNLSGSHPLKISNATPYEGQVTLTLSSGASQGNGDVWWTDIGLFAGEYDGPGFSEDTGWFQVDGNWYYATRGADGYITAIPGRVIFTYPTDDIKRFMHDVATSSGPLLIEELPTGNGKHHGAIMEFTVQSERGYIYTSPRNIDVTGAVLGSAADTEYNLMQNPGSVPDTGAAQHTVGANLCPNPSLEGGDDGWVTFLGLGDRVQGELRMDGDYSYRVELGDTGAAHVLFPRFESPLPNELSGIDRYTLGFWASLSGELEHVSIKVFNFGAGETATEVLNAGESKYFIFRGIPIGESEGMPFIAPSLEITSDSSSSELSGAIHLDAVLYQVP